MGQPYLIDTNVLLLLVKRDHSDFPIVFQAIARLRHDGATLYYTLQNMAEFWNASTRPLERNGFGLSIAATEDGAREIEEAFQLLPDNLQVYREWRRLVATYQVRGAQVHDARLLAVMRTFEIRHILTFNRSDFDRYADIIVLSQQELQT